MCWVSNNAPIKQVAEKDIPIFKVLRVKFGWRLISLYQNFEYKVGLKYSTEIGNCDRLDDPLSYIINEGFHSYSKDCKISIYAISLKISYDREPLDLVSLLSRCGKAVIAEGIIPKGSEYYLNELGEYVSNSIIINKFSEYDTKRTL